MVQSLEGKNIIVTGASSGIGKAIAEKFVRHGAFVNNLDLHARPDESQIKTYVCDITNAAQVNKVINEISQKSKIDVLVNNAGVAHVGNIEQVEEEQYDKVFNINAKGVFNCSKAVIEKMKTTGGGAIINIASIAGTHGVSKRFVYSATKGAVIAMTYSIAKDYIEDNIRCNSISPARIHTPFVDGFIKDNFPGKEKEKFDELAASQPIGRMGSPEEVASLALFLASDEAQFITGTDYPIDGGYLKLK